MTHTCPICGVFYSGPRNKKTCSGRCRKQKSRLGLASWNDVKSELVKMGLDATKNRMATDDTYRDQLIGHLERQEGIHPPTGPVVTPDDITSEVLALVTSDGYHVSDVYGYRLPSDADIDAAEASGDWSGMLNDALDSMMWQFANGYQPDLREFDRMPPMADLIAKSEEWLRSIEDQAETDSDQDMPDGFGMAA